MEGKIEKRGAWEIASSGTCTDAPAPRILAAAFLAMALIIVAVPSVGMLWARTDSTSENRELAAAPQLFESDGSFNWSVLSDAGSYFDDHFAYRNTLVTANAKLRAFLGASATDQAVVGTDDWLYYGGTLPDYLGQSELSERALRNIAHNLSQAQAYARAHGASFVFTVAPNKNTLYPEHMPYNYVRAPWRGNAALLKPFLEEYGVNYVDLFDLFRQSSECRYLARDTHWDNRGALMASQALLQAVEHARLQLDEASALKRTDFTGDLESMLFPSSTRTEANWYFDGYNTLPGMTGDLWKFTEGADVTDSFARTESTQGTGSVAMFRDSFGNSLLPYWAAAYESATFSKLVPYNLPGVLQEGVDAVVIERAERHLDYLASDPPIMPAPVLSKRDDWPTYDNLEGQRSILAISTDGPYWKIAGMIPDDCAKPSTAIYLSVVTEAQEAMTIEPAWTTVQGERGVSDYGFQAYLSKGSFDIHKATIGIYAVTDGEAHCLGMFSGAETAESL